jgi:DNA-binding transcriptional LysR family regulator
MRLTFHQLRLLLAVSREGSVSRAAQRLHLTQPTLSPQLRQLAEQVGLPLFERVGRRLHLTAAGRVVLDTAARVEQELENLDETLAELRGDVVGRLRLAVVSTAETFIPRLLGDFRRERPAVEVSLVVLNRDAVIRRLADNLDDLYIMSRPPPAPPVVATPFLANPLVVIAAAEHALARPASRSRHWRTRSSCCASPARAPARPPSISSPRTGWPCARAWSWAATRR